MHRVIAIDGPAASGKSSTARAVAEHLGWAHLDSGALYRAAALVALRMSPQERTGAAVRAAAEQRAARLVRRGVRYAVEVGGQSADRRIRSPDVTALVSAVAALPEVREWITSVLRRTILAEADAGIVVDGRDIGTDVFPEAPVKIFLTAAPAERAKRRLRQQGDEVDPERLGAETDRLAARDTLDSSRAHAPLRRAEDAHELDTTGLSFDQQVARILAVAQEVFSD